MHGKTIFSSTKTEVSSVLRESEIFEEELLSNVSNDLYIQKEFCDKYSKINASNNSLYIYLTISSHSYHHQELYNLIANMLIKSTIIDIFKSRLTKRKLPMNNIFLPNFTFEHMITFTKSLKYKVSTDLIIYKKNMIKSIFGKLISEDNVLNNTG